MILKLFKTGTEIKSDVNFFPGGCREKYKYMYEE